MSCMIAYTMVGGLKATILTDWIHTFILLIIIIIFSLTAYASSDILGSPSAVYDLLVQAAQAHPVDGNKDGSYLVRLLLMTGKSLALVLCKPECSLERSSEQTTSDRALLTRTTDNAIP